MTDETVNMYVTKRNGQVEELSYNKIIHRLKQLMPESTIQYSNLVIKIMDQLYNNIQTYKIDELMSELCASLGSTHPDYSKLSSLICISNHQKEVSSSLSTYIKSVPPNYLSTVYTNTVLKYEAFFDNIIDYSRDYLIDYFGFKTLERAYLIKNDNKVVERIQHLWLRVAIQIHGEDLNKVKETYDCLSKKEFIHATPTLYNSGTLRPQLSSCFLLAMEDDSIEGIFNTVKDCANISKWAGGIGLHIHNVRAEGTHIKGTNGTSNGIVPMLRVFNNTARYVDQGGGKRNGSFAMYLEPWHADIEQFLDLRKNHGEEEMRARDLFYALWIPDLFMKKVEHNEDWYLMCPHISKGLADVYGEEFETLYNSYVSKEMYIKKISARELWFKILDSQMETGTPYMLYKDACNMKSNQKNLGTIKSSNLCCEIIEYSDPRESAVCNLASISLASMVENGVFDYEKLHKITKHLTENLNKLIDVNYYPTEKTKNSNSSHRPIGIGVQGLADAFALMNIAFESNEAIEANKLIFETIYHASIEKSMELSKQHGYYKSFFGSPISKGIFQFDLWNVTPSNRYDWETLRSEIKFYGIRNSLCVAPMPTASTSQILSNNECFEPFTSNIYTRRTLAGEFVVINKHLMKELIDLNIWSVKIKDKIIEHKGSIQHIDEIPLNIKKKYKIVWEIPMKHIINMARDRGAFICQSQSMNLWIEEPNYKILTSMHLYSWKCGLKTGMYYLRRKAKHQAQQFTIIPEKEDCLTCSA
uniref:ribonucleoside-diphosphate reductase n=1 Tax=viral metagenome TaxID=1070528 RepID=A0A6C0JJA7_9ZZZZ